MAQREQVTSGVKRLAVVAPDALSLLRQRDDLLQAVLAGRHSVLVLIPERDAESSAALTARGYHCATYPDVADAPQMFADSRAVKLLSTAFSEWRPHVVLGYGAKSMLLAAIAGKQAGAPRNVALVTTLGPFLVEPSAVPAWSTRRLIARGMKAIDAAIFHNADAPLRLRRLGLLPQATPFEVVPGAGVDLARHAVLPLPPLSLAADNSSSPGLTFAMIGRQDMAKGVMEFCKAATIVRDRSAPQARFILAGPHGDIAAEALEPFKPALDVRGDVDDVRSILSQAHVVVVPSWAEGMPRILAEALAAGRPVITTDIPGAREAVDERINGVLVPRCNAEALARAMESFLKRPDLIPSMARASRMKAERRFNVEPINATILRSLGL